MAKTNTLPRTRRGAPKHEQVREILRQRIKDGLYPPGTRLPPEIELPRQLGVGNQTVRHALNDLVREGLIIRRRGSGSFVADRRRHPVLPNRALRIGILWHSSVFPEGIKGKFQGAITMGAIEALGLDGVSPEWAMSEPLEATRVQWDSATPKLTAECIGEAPQGHPRHPPLSEVAAGRFDGLLVLSIIEDSFLREVLKLGIPTVLVDVMNDAFLREADQVFVDPYLGYREAVRHFAGQGLKRMHFIPGYVSRPLSTENRPIDSSQPGPHDSMRVDPDSYLRLNAFRQGMHECGLPLREEWIHFSENTRRHTNEVIKTLTALPEDERPEVVFAHSASHAEQVIEAFKERGWPLQGAGSVVTGHPLHALPIRVDPQAMGAVAVELLAGRLQRPERPCLRVGVPMLFEAPTENSVNQKP